MALKRRGPLDFNAIDGGERLRWSLGLVLTKDNYTPLHRTREPGGPTIWESWAAWGEVYGTVRAEFLARYHERFDTEPLAERLYRAFQRDGDVGAASESAAIAEEEREATRQVYAQFRPTR